MKIGRSLASLFLAIAVSLASGNSRAAAPQCYVYGSGGFCQYNGKVREAYMNAYDEVILYFDADVDPAHAASVGLTGITVTNAAKFNMAGNKDFGKSLFAALLAAQARGAHISVQMHSVSGGYLVLDRIWVKE